MSDFEELKKESLFKLQQFRNEYLKADDMGKKEYLRQRIIDFLQDLVDKGFKIEELNPIYERIKNINSFGNIYGYSLAENLREQITIVVDSIRASPVHQKMLDLQNTAMIQYPEILEKQ